MVGARGFEPRASCAQGSRPSFSKSIGSNPRTENADFSCARTLCPGVSGCARVIVGSLQKSLHQVAKTACSKNRGRPCGSLKRRAGNSCTGMVCMSPRLAIGAERFSVQFASLDMARRANGARSCAEMDSSGSRGPAWAVACRLLECGRVQYFALMFAGSGGELRLAEISRKQVYKTQDLRAGFRARGMYLARILENSPARLQLRNRNSNSWSWVFRSLSR